MPSRAQKTKRIRKRLFNYALKKFGSYEKIPIEQRIRLEREPVFFTGKDRLRELSLAAISFHAPEKALREGISAFGEIIIRKKVMPKLNLPREERVALEKALSDLKKDSYLYGKFWGMMNYSFRDTKDFQKKYYGIFIYSLSTNIGKHLPTGTYANYDEKRERSTQIAEKFFSYADTEMWLSSQKSRFAKLVGLKPRRKINLLSGWGWLEEIILAEKNATAFFESKQNIDRGQLYKQDTKTFSVAGLAGHPYDYSKVKEFSVVSRKGEKVTIVSKRLSPIKSAFAEKEFKAGVVLFNMGFPVPEPIGEIKEGGNVYFLWKKIDRSKSIAFDDPRVGRQIEEIARRLEQNGIKHLDFDQRNFVITNENGYPKVWLIDLERMQIPPKVVRKYLKKK